MTSPQAFKGAAAPLSCPRGALARCRCCRSCPAGGCRWPQLRPRPRPPSRGSPQRGPSPGQGGAGRCTPRTGLRVRGWGAARPGRGAPAGAGRSSPARPVGGSGRGRRCGARLGQPAEAEPFCPSRAGPRRRSRVPLCSPTASRPAPHVRDESSVLLPSFCAFPSLSGCGFPAVRCPASSASIR